MSKVLLEISNTYEREFLDLEQSLPGEFQIVKSNRFDGTDGLLQAIVTLSTLSIPLIAKVIIEAIRARKHVSIKVNGTTITGVSEKTVLKILEGFSRDN